MDPKVIDLCSKLEIGSLDEFKKEQTYRNVIVVLDSYAPSTAENYIWRLHRCLKSYHGFPPKMLQKYSALLAHYKALYVR